MSVWATPYASALMQTRAARGEIEHALDHAGWPRSRRLSLLLDGLVVLEESGRE